MDQEVALQNCFTLETGQRLRHRKDQELRVVEKHNFKGFFSMYYQYSIDKAAVEAGEACRLLFMLVARVKYENVFTINKKKIIERMGVSHVTFYAHMAKLRELGLIVPDDGWDEPDSRTLPIQWRMCPYLAWRGDTVSRDVYIKELPADHVFRQYDPQPVKPVVPAEAQPKDAS